jgi:hypothetical protein
MGELYEAVFERYPINRINGTRSIKLVWSSPRAGKGRGRGKIMDAEMGLMVVQQELAEVKEKLSASEKQVAKLNSALLAKITIADPAVVDRVHELEDQVAELTAKLAERDKAITNAADGEEWCPFCGNSIRPKFDCKNCSVDHLGSECFRSGAHKDGCIVAAIGKSALAASGEKEEGK